MSSEPPNLCHISEGNSRLLTSTPNREPVKVVYIAFHEEMELLRPSIGDFMSVIDKESALHIRKRSEFNQTWES